jgi:alpha/beta superfamily hydrolase
MPKTQQVVSLKVGRFVAVTGSPDASHSRGLAVFCHTWSSHKAEATRLFSHLAERLREDGWHTLQFDFRGCGDSDGVLEETNLTSMSHDLLDMLEWCSDQCLPSPNVLVGFGTGGCVALLMARSISSIANMVLLSPVLRPIPLRHEWLTRTEYSELEMHGVLEIADLLQEAADHRHRTILPAARMFTALCSRPEMLCGQRLGVKFVTQLEQLDVQEQLSDSRQKKIVVLGGHDAELERMLSRARNDSGNTLDISVLEGAGRWFSPEPHRMHVVEICSEWLRTATSRGNC